MKLITVRNYAKQKDFSTTWVYKLIAEKKVKVKIIDGVTFVKVEE